MQHRFRFSSLALAAGLAVTGMAWAGSEDRSAARDEDDCEIVHSRGGTGSGLSSSVTAGAGGVTGSTTTGGNGQSVTVRSGNGTSSSTVTSGASSSSGSSVVAGAGSGDCVVTIGPDGKTETKEKSR